MIVQLTEFDLFGSGQGAPRDFAEILRTDGDGRIVVSFAPGTAHRRNLERCSALLSTLGSQVSVYPAQGVWTNLGVRQSASAMRTHGTGENPLHIDLVCSAQPPRYIALYCMRPDPKGGGASATSDLWAAADKLSEEDHAALSSPCFKYWADKNVFGVGQPLDRFAVIPPTRSAPVRFTAKMLPHLRQGKLLDHPEPLQLVTAFEHLVQRAEELRTEFRLAARQMLVFDQWRYAHGRMPLGAGQAAVAAGARRLLKQSYVSGGRP
jgi:hypothetical protein